MRLANGPLPWSWIDPDKALPWVEERIGLALAESQVAAIRLALMSKVLVMTGGPGVGKTTIINAILRILAAKGTNLLLCAPTGRAAKRMTEASGFEAKTIHRLLEVDPKGGGFKPAITTRARTRAHYSLPIMDRPCRNSRQHNDHGSRGLSQSTLHQNLPEPEVGSVSSLAATNCAARSIWSHWGAFRTTAR